MTGKNGEKERRLLVYSELHPESPAVSLIKVTLLPSKQEESFFSKIPTEEKKSHKLLTCKNIIS